MLTRRRKKMNAGDPIQDDDSEENPTSRKKAREDIKLDSSESKKSSSPSTVTTTSDLMERMSLSNESAKSKPGSPLGTPPVLDYEGHEEEGSDLDDEIPEYLTESYNFLQSSDDIAYIPTSAPILSPVLSPSAAVLSQSPCSTPPPTLELPPDRERASSPDDSLASHSPIKPEYNIAGPSRRSPPELLPFSLSCAGSFQNSSSSDDEKVMKSFDHTSRNSWKVLADFGKNIVKTVSSKLGRESPEANKKKGRKLKTFRGRNAKKMEELRQKDLQIGGEEKKVREGHMPLLEYHCESMKRKHFKYGLTKTDIDDIRSTIIDMMQTVVDLPPIPEKKHRSKKVFNSTREFFLRSRQSSVTNKRDEES